MKQIVAVYCEGREVKAVLIEKNKEGVKIRRVISLSGSEKPVEVSAGLELAGGMGIDNLGEDISIDGLEENTVSEDKSTGIEFLSESLKDFNLSKAAFIPVLTEPVVTYHQYEGETSLPKNKFTEILLRDIVETKGVEVNRDSIDYLTINDRSALGVFVESDIPCVNMINTLASMNKRRFYKIPAIKCAELSLARLVTKNRKFGENDYSLIIYAGREYSKFIFLKGGELNHIGSTIDLGTSNLSAHDVYFSKILLEMEHGAIPRLDNVIITSDDDPEDLILSFYSAFPEAEVSKLELDGYDVSELDEDSALKFSSFAIPLAAALEYVEETDKEYTGINILPRYVRENQKVLQFGWHSYALLPLIFFSAYFITNTVLTNMQQSSELDMEIQRLTQIQERNRELLDEMKTLSATINNFDNTQAILDEASAGAEVYSDTFERIAAFMELRRNFWITGMKTGVSGELTLTGYSLSRSSLTEFAEYNELSLLKNMIFEPLRDKRTFSYIINLRLFNEDPVENGS